MHEDDGRQPEGWQQIAGDTSPGSVGAEDQGTEAADTVRGNAAPSEGVPPTEQRGGTTPDAAEAREKGEWAGTVADGMVPAALGGSDAPDEMLAEDPALGSEVLGRTTGSDEPATTEGIDPAGGEAADATSDGGPELPPPGVEPQLKDAGIAQSRADRHRD